MDPHLITQLVTRFHQLDAYYRSLEQDARDLEARGLTHGILDARRGQNGQGRWVYLKNKGPHGVTSQYLGIVDSQQVLNAKEGIERRKQWTILRRRMRSILALVQRMDKQMQAVMERES